ncbi:MAG: fumarate reductase/succinate dehydrogenase flavoprotein subunit, partial [Pyrinomonadaceae bacterium]
AGEYAAEFAKQNSHGTLDNDEIERITKAAIEPFEREGGENPFGIQSDLQELMQANVGIVRTHDEMIEALNGLDVLRNRAAKAYSPGNIDFNPGWHTALDLHNLLTVSEAITRAALERKESRGGQFRDDFPEKDPEFGKINFSLKKTEDGAMQIDRIPIPEMPDYLKQIVEEMG